MYYCGIYQDVSLASEEGGPVVFSSGEMECGVVWAKKRATHALIHVCQRFFLLQIVMQLNKPL
jgi:hypothetical protein